jgi:glutaredoxin
MQATPPSDPTSTRSTALASAERRAPRLALALLAAASLMGAACDLLHDDAALRAQPQPAAADVPAAQAPAKQVVEVFVTDWCPYCRRLEAYLQENDVEYVRLDIEKNGDALREHQRLGGGGGIPVTRVGSQVVWGFRPDVIGKLLGIPN